MLEEPTLCLHLIIILVIWLVFLCKVFPSRSAGDFAQLTRGFPIGEAAVVSHAGEYCPVLASLMIVPISKYIRSSLSLLLISFYSSLFSSFLLVLFFLPCVLLAHRPSTTEIEVSITPLCCSYACVNVHGCIHLSELVLPFSHPHPTIPTHMCAPSFAFASSLSDCTCLPFLALSSLYLSSLFTLAYFWLYCCVHCIIICSFVEDCPDYLLLFR